MLFLKTPWFIAYHACLWFTIMFDPSSFLFVSSFHRFRRLVILVILYLLVWLNLATAQTFTKEVSISTDSVLSVFFGQQCQQYLQNAPKLPLSFTTHNGNFYSFDGFGSNQQPQFLHTCNNLDAAKTLATQHLWNGGSLGLNLGGNGIQKLGMWDGGAARTTHQELSGRVSIIDAATLSAHSTAVAGTLIAAGVNPNAKGMAHQAQLKNWNFSNDNAEVIAAAPNLLLSNHSYAGTTAWQYISGSWYWYGDSSLNQFEDWKFGYYDNRSRISDSVMFANPYYLMVKAAGNDRGSGVAPGTTHYYWNGSAWALTNTTRDTVGPYDCLSTSANAKNGLTIGAIYALPNGYSNPSQVSLLSNSSWGPTDDGRIKPDLVGASGSILSSTSTGDADYAYLGGTSMATPNVAGSLLLLQEYFYQLKGRYMRNASLKALAIHTANRCKNNPGPDYECGWGIPNLERAALCLRDSFEHTLIEDTLQNLHSYRVDVFLNTMDTLRITLAWTDPKGTTTSPIFDDTSPKLINDLDVRLYNQQGDLVGLPFVLDPTNPSAAADTGNNVLDNVEQILAPNMAAGVYTIEVKHKASLQNSLGQTFSLIISGAPLPYDTMPKVWIGQVSAAWQDSSNWYQQALPANQASVVITAGLYQPTLSTSYQAADLHIHQGATFTLKDTLALGGNLQCEGEIIADSGVIIFNGTTAQSLGIDVFKDQALFGLTLNNAAGLTLTDTLRLIGTLNLVQGTLSTNAYLVLTSTASGTARMAPVGNASLNGILWVERYLPARRAYRFLASPVSTLNGIDDNWQHNTHITGTGGVSNGFDSSITNNPSMFTLNESTQPWSAVNHTQNQNLQQGVGYRLMIRGNRSIDLNNPQSLPTSVVLLAGGTHVVGDKTYHSSSIPALSGVVGNYTFIGNPFASAIDWNAISRTNVSSTYYTWNAQIGSHGRGAYVNYNALGNVSSDGNVNQYIGSGTAFMVKTTGANPSITIEEQDKVSNTQGSQLLGKAKEFGLRVQLIESDSMVADAMYVYQNDLAEDALDAYDSEKWLNPGISLYSYTNDGKKVSIHGFKDRVEGKQISLGIENHAVGNYQLKFSEWEEGVWQLWLRDKYKEVAIPIGMQTTYDFEVSTDEGSADGQRFELIFKQSVLGKEEATLVNTISLHPIPASDVIVLTKKGFYPNDYGYQIFDQMGQVLASGEITLDGLGLYSMSIANLLSGIYYLRVFDAHGSTTLKFIKK